MPKGKAAPKSDPAAIERAEAIKNQLVSQYLHLATAMKRCHTAVEAYATALNEAVETDEIITLLRAPPATRMPSGLPEQLPFITTSGEGSSTSKKRGPAADSEDELVDGDEEGGPKKKRRAKKEKKIVDPNAPKRPASAYILFQNVNRGLMKEQNPDLPYQELLQKIGEAWKALGVEGQAQYKEAADQAMGEWREKTVAYAAEGKEEGEDENGTPSSVAAPLPVVKEKKEKKPSAKATKAAAAAAPEVEVPAAGSKSEPKKRAVTKAAASTPAAAATSTPAAKSVAAPRPASAAAKKSAPAPAQQAAESSSGSGSDDDSDDSSDAESD